MKDSEQPVHELQNALLTGVATTGIYDFLKETTLAVAPRLSEQTGNTVLLKREDLQPVFSFKIRGAYHKMIRLGQEGKLAAGVVACSAGNHAQGVALAAQKLNCKATIVMPEHTQQIKVNAVRHWGAEVILRGENVDDSLLIAEQLVEKTGACFIPPFDDADIIAGNATIAAEIIRQHRNPIDVLFCSIGGGGLIAGIAGYIKLLRPEIRIVGVEAEDSACMLASIQAGKRVTLDEVGRFADAVAVKTPGRLPFNMVRQLVDQVITASNDEMCGAVKDLYEDTRVIFEPAGALAVAGLKNYCQQNNLRQKNLIALTCGANMNFDSLKFVAERAEIGEGREALFGVTIPERPGAFRDFCKQIGTRSVTEFNYRMDDPERAHIFVGIRVSHDEERRQLAKQLVERGLDVLDLTDNETAKLHIRHMVGGRSPVPDELLYRFEFPERPGALMNFLEMLGKQGMDWNISLFHYRNHGADVGRVLAGIQVPAAESARFGAFLERLGYPFREESANPTYRLFLQASSSASDASGKA